jgi:predicted transcriptional regulator
LRDRILDFLKMNYPAAFTPDEVADRLGVSILSVRPRVTELLRGGLIVKTTTRRLNKSGMPAVAVRWLGSMKGESL